MAIMKIRGIQKSFNERIVIQKAEFDIKQDSRIGLVGSNGAGKTTLANLINGEFPADKGSIETFNGALKIGYLKQSTEQAFLETEDAYPLAENGLFHHSSQLGLTKEVDVFNRNWSNLSGGEKLKLSLAGVWASRPEMLILDEPTNHLDLQGVEWLIEELRAFKGAIVIISHDRYFLDRTVSEIIEMEDGITKSFTGNYSAYRQEKERLYQVQLHQYELQQKHKQQIQQQIANLKGWSEKAHRDSTKQGTASERRQIGYKEYHRMKAKKMDNQIKSKMKRLNQELEKGEVKQPKEESRVQFEFQDRRKRGKRIIEAAALSKYFGHRCLFDKSYFYVNHGEKMGLVGQNGSGKTTMMKILLGQENASSGDVWLSESLKIGYLSQDVSDLPAEKTAMEYTGLTDREAIGRARTIFANIGLHEEKLNVPIGQLSLGERTRVKLVMMLLEELDLLLLDEPTNHLDLASRESLEKTLLDFQGSLLVVSHDVYFLEKITEKLLVIENGKITRKEFGMREYNEANTRKDNDKEKAEQLMVLQNEINAIIGRLSYMTKDEPGYEELDQKLAELFRKKRELA
ncbi:MULTISPECIES: ribosomal protection-like ABC-F family protein [unclassified Mesobacillus]|uniref:ribosomal protection-like ABC-F family protein n=1 Tax=unclassified Mesobacillus TaxID=2675270 RepID=UPI002040644F|nr:MULTISPECIES: ABC-F type ribosomal protection protein [unclassified Mesobacillus]MCM3121980.1 ABC-F type ribosomal protection protein [Mesobacillus sp. MER 33]MCM3231944.1 ABC-F type ribosomal protection protein [Mesobacillus sp. MER 48]